MSVFFLYQLIQYYRLPFTFWRPNIATATSWGV